MFALSWACLTFCALPAARAKAYFSPRDEMVARADLIAVVDITHVEKLEPTLACGLARATATVERVIKGSSKRSLSFLVPCFFPCAVVRLDAGRHLVFLRENATGELAGVNWHLSYRRVTDGEMDWYQNDRDTALERRSVGAVLQEIADIIAKQR